MNENKDTGQEYGDRPEEQDDSMTPEEREMAKFWLPKYSEKKTPKEELRDCEKEILELQRIFQEFEVRHPLNELYAITDLTPEDASKHAAREPARIALNPILAALNELREQTNISPERYGQLKSRYEYLSKAVGIIRNNKVRH